MKIFIIKHGQTIENLRKVCTGQLPGELSDEGRKQADEYGKKFQKENIDLVYSSDLKRAVDTAEIILNYLPGLKLWTDERIRERNFGELQGAPFPKDLDWGNMPKSVETETQMQVRADKFIEMLKQNYSSENILLVCHDGIRANLISAILDKPVRWQDIKDTEIHELDL